MFVQMSLLRLITSQLLPPDDCPNDNHHAAKRLGTCTFPRGGPATSPPLCVSFALSSLHPHSCAPGTGGNALLIRREIHTTDDVIADVIVT